jgi:hypothetical protein
MVHVRPRNPLLTRSDGARAVFHYGVCAFLVAYTEGWLGPPGDLAIPPPFAHSEHVRSVCRLAALLYAWLLTCPAHALRLERSGC